MSQIKFLFTAMDATGQYRKGKIEAPSKAEAISSLSRKGLEVTDITESPDHVAPLLPPLPAAPAAPQPTQHVPTPSIGPGKGFTKPTLPKMSGKMSERLPLILSSIALVLASAALAKSFLVNPLGRGIEAYDFKTPEAAARSMIELQGSNDAQAMRDLMQMREGSPEEALRTFEVHKAVDFKDDKLVFISFLKRGKKSREVECFEKDPESKLWFPKFVSAFDVEKVDEKIAKEMRDWTGD